MELFFQFREKSLHYKKEGTGEALVLIHGFLENLSMWDEMAVELSKTNQVIRIDLPGFGKSDCIEDIHSMALFAECIKQLLNELNIVKFTLIGHSMGGYAGLELLKICPEKINHFILFHSTAKADSEKKKTIDHVQLKWLRTNKTFISKLLFLFYSLSNFNRLVLDTFKK